jgi:hypothetical protein
MPAQARNYGRQMFALSLLLVLSAGFYTLHARRPAAPESITVMTSDLSQSAPLTVSTNRVSIAESVTGPVAGSSTGFAAGWLSANTDKPLVNGPPAILWTDGETSYRAVHFIAAWDASLQTWRALSPDVTEDKTPHAPGYGVDGITAVAHDDGVWYAGTLAGQLTVKFPGQPWSILRGGLPQRTVTSIAILPGNTVGRLAAIGYGGYSTTTPDEPGHVYLTRDGGSAWTDITGNLPDHPVQSLHFSDMNGSQVLSAEMNNRWYTMTAPGQWAMEAGRG